MEALSDIIGITNNTRGGIEGEIRERGYWRGNLDPGNCN